MKGCVIALIVLMAVLAIITVNAVYVHRVADSLIERLEALPAVPDPRTTPVAVAALRQELEDNHIWLGLSINFTVLDRAREAAGVLEVYAENGDCRQYAASIAILRNLFENFGRLEKLSADNLV